MLRLHLTNFRCRQCNARRYYFDNQVLVTKPSEIRAHYLKSWFAIDLVSVLPFDHLVRLFGNHAGDEENIARSTRFVRFTRLMRFARLIKLAKLTQLRNAMTTLSAFLNNIGVSAMEIEFGAGSSVSMLQPSC